VIVNVASASATTLNWTASWTLNPSGPNYSVFSIDTSEIISQMTNYIANLPVGTNFSRSTANAAMLAIYGPAGTNDIVSNGFTTSTPSGDVSATATTKFVPGTVSIV
jgi:hypothetical protein